MDLISVIIPVYNVKQYLDRCMASVLGQTYENLQIILVDDKSTDGSLDICETYLYDNRVLIIKHPSNMGLSAARNTGLENARGRYVVFVDSDDYIEKRMVQNFYEKMKESGADTVIAGFKQVRGKKIKEVRNSNYEKVYIGTEEITKNILQKMLGPNNKDYIEMSVWKSMFSMDIINSYGIKFPDRQYLCEDIIFDFGYYPLSKKVAMCDDVSYCYCYNNDSLSQSYSKNKDQRILFQAREMRKLALSKNLSEEANIRIDNFLIGNIVHHFKCLISSTENKDYKINKLVEVCSTRDLIDIHWSEAFGFFKGSDSILIRLVKYKKYRLLYYYLVLYNSIKSLFL